MNFRFAFALISAVALVTVRARAATMTLPYSHDFGGKSDFSGDWDYPQFDPSLGTLTGVKFSKTLLVSPTVVVTNSGSSRSFTVTASGVLGYNLPGITAITTGTPIGNPRRFDIMGGPTSISAGGKATFTLPSTFLQPPDDTLGPSDSHLADYIGAGSVHLSYSLLFGASVSPSSNAHADASLVHDLNATITYSYTPIAEPSTAILFLVAVGGAHLAASNRTRTDSKRAVAIVAM